MSTYAAILVLMSISFFKTGETERMMLYLSHWATVKSFVNSKELCTPKELTLHMFIVFLLCTMHKRKHSSVLKKLAVY